MKRFLFLLLLVGLIGQSSTIAEESARKVKTLVDYKTELSLTDQQIKDIGEALNGFKTTLVAQRQQLTQLEKDFQKLLNDKAALDQIKQKLNEIAATNASMRYADVVTSRKVESILSADQMTKWRDIQSKARASAPEPAKP